MGLASKELTGQSSHMNINDSLALDNSYLKQSTSFQNLTINHNKTNNLLNKNHHLVNEAPSQVTKFSARYQNQKIKPEDSKKGDLDTISVTKIVNQKGSEIGGIEGEQYMMFPGG